MGICDNPRMAISRPIPKQPLPLEQEGEGRESRKTGGRMGHKGRRRVGDW